MSDFNLISAAERKALLDAIRRLGDFGQFSEGEVADLSARVEAAQTHVGLAVIREELPPEMPPLPAAPSQPSPWLMPAAPPAPAPTRAARTVPLVIGGAVLAIGLAIGVVNRDVDPSDPDIPEIPEIPDQLILRVGVDIQPGIYMVDDGPLCYWERVRGFSGGTEDIIQNDMGSGARHVVEVLASDAGLVYSPRCGTWKPYAPPPAPLTTFPDGDWLVGTDIVAGRYRSTGPSGADQCLWERADDFTHDPDETIDLQLIDDPGDVTVRDGERFSSSDCGTWTKVG